MLYHSLLPNVTAEQPGLYGGSVMSDGGVKVECCQHYGSLATEGFNQPCYIRGKGMATLTKMSVTNRQCKISEGCMLLGEEGVMTRNERVLHKEMDEAGQGTEKGELVIDNENVDK